EAAAAGRLAARLEVDAPAVVGHFDVDRPALVRRAEMESSLRRLAELAPGLLRLNAVGNGVPHQMNQRVGHQLDDRGVHLDRLASYLEAHGLAGGARRLANHAPEPHEEPAGRHHSRARGLAALFFPDAL